MNIGRNLTELRTDATNGLYQNLNYQTERVSKKNLVIDTAYCSSNGKNGDFEDHTLYDNDNKEFRCELTEKLIIDRLSEVYIDSISFINLNNSIKDGEPIYLNFINFPKFSYSNNPYARNKYVISESWSGGNHDKAKAKKMSYLTTVNPMTIEDIEFTLEYENAVYPPSTLGGIFKKDGSGRAIIELVIVSKD